MRIQIGDRPTPAATAPEAEGWTRIVSPSSPAVHVWVWIAGIGTAMILLALIVLASLVVPARETGSRVDGPTPWAAILLALLVAVPAHELAHAVFYPGGGLSSRTTLVAWPHKLRFGVYFEGCMSRRRWLLMRLAPLALLGIGPALCLVATQGLPCNPGLEAALSLLLLVNALGAGGDLLAAGWVVRNIPGGASLAFFGGRAYWRPGPCGTPH